MDAPSTWLVLALSGLFVLLGLVFVTAPRLGAAIFGISAPEGMGLVYVDAVGLRDLAFGLYLVALSRLSTRHVLGVIFAATTIIPLGDLAIVAIERGPGAPLHLLLHGASAAVMAGTSAWLLAQDIHDNREHFAS